MAINSYTTTKGTRWRVRLYDADTRRMVSVSAAHTTKRAARQAEADAIAAGGPTAQSRLTVAGWRDTWLAEHPMKASTRIHNAERTRLFAKEHGHLRLADVDRAMARRWRAKHPSTTAALSAMWTAAQQDEDLPVGQPWAGMATGRTRRLEPGWLTATDIDQLRQHAETAWPGAYGRVVSALIVTLAYTGIRPGEIAGLFWTDLHPDRGRLDVVRQVESKSRALTTPKNGHPRTVVYPRAAQDAIARMPKLDDQHVFVGPAGGLLTGAVRDRIWRPVRVAFGRPTMQIYELRHYAGTYLMEHGLTSADVAVQLGHRDGGRLVESVYGHARPDPALDRVTRVLDGDDTQELAS